MSEADGDRQLTVGELARAIERGSIRGVVRGGDYEIPWREINRLRLGLAHGLAHADLWLLFQSGGGVEIGPGGEDISQAV